MQTPFAFAITTRWITAKVILLSREEAREQRREEYYSYYLKNPAILFQVPFSDMPSKVDSKLSS